jgi:hypothetical protein
VGRAANLSIKTRALVEPTYSLLFSQDAVTTYRRLRAQIQDQVVQFVDGPRALIARTGGIRLAVNRRWDGYEQLIHHIAHGPSESPPQDVRARKTSPGVHELKG